MEPFSAFRKICIACVGGLPCGILLGSTFQCLASCSTVLRIRVVHQRDELAVRPALACVLSRRLAIHLENGAAGLADHAAHEVQIVDLNRGRRRLIGLIHALQDGRDQGRRSADDLGGMLEIARSDLGHVRRPLRCPLRDHFLQLLEAGGMRFDIAMIHSPIAQHQMQQPVHQGHVRPMAEVPDEPPLRAPSASAADRPRPGAVCAVRAGDREFAPTERSG
jgi:hypothetical protein